MNECAISIHEALSENIYEHFDRYIPVAIEAAVQTATNWGQPRPIGLAWATYKATCRRLGVYAGISGLRDFNAELFEPISRQLAGGWERAFQRRLPSCLDGFTRNAKLLVETFHREATYRAQQKGTNYQGLHLLNNQLRAHLQKVSEIPGMMLALIQDFQRDANREFTPEIQTRMTPAYDACK